MILTFKQAYDQYFKGILGINKLRELVKQNLIPVVDIPSSKTYFDSEQIELWLKRPRITIPQIVVDETSQYGKLRRIEE